MPRASINTFPFSRWVTVRRYSWLVLNCVLLFGVVWLYIDRVGQRYLVMKSSTHQETTFQVFWNTGEGFSEADSARHFTVGEASTHWKLKIPTTRLQSIRLDPSLENSIGFTLNTFKIVDGWNYTIIDLLCLESGIQFLDITSETSPHSRSIAGRTTGIDSQILFILLPSDIARPNRIKTLLLLLTCSLLGMAMIPSVSLYLCNERVWGAVKQIQWASFRILVSVTGAYVAMVAVYWNPISAGLSSLLHFRGLEDSFYREQIAAIFSAISLVWIFWFWIGRTKTCLIKEDVREGSSNALGYFAGWLSRKHLPFCLILCIAAWLRMDVLSLPVRYDEAYTFMWYCRGNWWDVFYYTAPNNHVLHTILVKLSASILGDAEWSLRVPSFLFGLANVCLVYGIAFKKFGAVPAWVASFLLALFPFTVLFDGMARGYSMATFFQLVAIAYLLESRSSLLKQAFICALLMALGMLVMPSFLFSVAGITLYFALRCINVAGWLNGGFRLLTLLLAFLSLSFFAYIPVFLRTESFSSVLDNRFIQNPDSDTFFSEQIASHSKQVYEIISRDVGSAVWTILAIALLWVLVKFLISGRKCQLLQLTHLVLVGALMVFFAKQLIPYPRTWLFVFPLLFLNASSILQGRFWNSYRAQYCIFAMLTLAGLGYAGFLVAGQKIASYPDTGRVQSLPETLATLRNKGASPACIRTDFLPEPSFEYYQYRWNWRNLDTISSPRFLILGVRHHQPQEFLGPEVHAVLLEDRGDLRIFEVSVHMPTRHQ